MNPTPTPTLATGFHEILQLIGSAAFQWLPGIATAIAGTQASAGVIYPAAPSAPASVGQALSYVQQMAAPGIYGGIEHDWALFVVISILLCLLFSALIIYCAVRVEQIRVHEELAWEEAAHPVAAGDVSKTQLRWKRIEEEIGSADEQRWRLAILEADIMLNELLDVKGYRGETMADKMRAVDRADFRSIDKAWEAHRVRNQVAHQGASLSISSYDAQRTIGLYRDVFREFNFIG